MIGSWWTGIPATEATLSCGDQTHRLVWNAGELTAPDHPDPEGERALAVLGGEPIPCITMLDTWHRHIDDPQILLLSSRGPADLIATQEEMPQPQGRPSRLPRGGRAGRPGAGSVRMIASSVGPSRATAPASESGGEQDLARLLSLGGAVGRRLETTVAAHWQARLLDPDDETRRLRARLHAAVYGRLLTTLSGWLDERDLVLELELLPPGERGSITRDASGAIQAALPFDWLVAVWGRGLETIWGRFCLAASSDDGREWRLETVDPGLREPQTVTVALPT
ncbi:MAG TPA: hypothetical protein VHU61_01095 [Solirubrobacteraceae bacterium]|nr:hypothetical protein [Solirubrobacteraceae bacterium]